MFFWEFSRKIAVIHSHIKELQNTQARHEFLMHVRDTVLTLLTSLANAPTTSQMRFAYLLRRGAALTLESRQLCTIPCSTGFCILALATACWKKCKQTTVLRGTRAAQLPLLVTAGSATNSLGQIWKLLPQGSHRDTRLGCSICSFVTCRYRWRHL